MESNIMGLRSAQTTIFCQMGKKWCRRGDLTMLPILPQATFHGESPKLRHYI